MTAKNGSSSVELGRRLGVKQPTAWAVKHKIMAVMARREGETALTGRVEMDDAYLGGVRSGGKRGRGAAGKTPFVAAVSTSPEGRPRKLKLAPVKGTAAFGSLDVLVNNAGIGFYRLFLDTTLEEWERVLRINLTGAFLVAQAAARRMVEQGSGRISNISSVSAQRGGTGRAAYGSSKAALTLLTKVMAVELAPAGIAVNAIAPGPIATRLTEHLGDDETRSYLDRIPMRRYGKVEDVAAAAVFLASDECGFVTGHVLNIDGGFGGAGLMFSQDELEHELTTPPA